MGVPAARGRRACRPVTSRRSRRNARARSWRSSRRSCSYASPARAGRRGPRSWRPRPVPRAQALAGGMAGARRPGSRRSSGWRSSRRRGIAARRGPGRGGGRRLPGRAGPAALVAWPEQRDVRLVAEGARDAGRRPREAEGAGTPRGPARRHRATRVRASDQGCAIGEPAARAARRGGARARLRQQGQEQARRRRRPLGEGRTPARRTAVRHAARFRQRRPAHRRARRRADRRAAGRCGRAALGRPAIVPQAPASQARRRVPLCGSSRQVAGRRGLRERPDLAGSRARCMPQPRGAHQGWPGNRKAYISHVWQAMRVLP